MSSYETYKPSGIDWIGKVPTHWQLKRIKDVSLKILGGGTPDTGNEDYWDWDKETGIPWVAIADITKSAVITDTEKFITQKGLQNSSAQLIDEGKILYSIYASLGKVAISGRKLATNQAILSIYENPNRVNLNFLKYYLINLEDIVAGAGSSTTQNNISLEKLRTFKIAFPEILEQVYIANYLDDQTPKIDRLISNKKAQAEKLKELRQIEINYAVTKGLNPNAEMKDSGIEWLGKIPKHWEKRKIATNFQIIGSGTTPDAGNEEYYDETGKYYFVNTGDLKDCEIYDCEKKITEEAFTKFTSLKLFPVNTLLIAMYGATIGKVGILKTEATTNQACCALANSYRFNIDYMFYFFIGIREDIIRLSYGGGQPNISQDTIKQLRIPCPPKDEQLQIVEHLQKRTTAIDQLIKNIETQIEKLQELRKIKIHEAVTGKVRTTDLND